ncbi:hypothetical protein [Paraburkholderia sp. Ac-20347]|jgi:hypothetical protein|nr:hypothetical protein [Paraburkholderia sp. Ac-20347]MBN3814849.1 hypothetical protein [Paraburkholderia sp. Ac-20347]
MDRYFSPHAVNFIQVNTHSKPITDDGDFFAINALGLVPIPVSSPR